MIDTAAVSVSVGVIAVVGVVSETDHDESGGDLVPVFPIPIAV